MTEALVVSIMIEAMRMATLLAAPMLIGALVVGLLVSIFQAVTQIQEQTLAIIPKMGAMMAVLAFLFPGSSHRQRPICPAFSLTSLAILADKRL